MYTPISSHVLASCHDFLITSYRWSRVEFDWESFDIALTWVHRSNFGLRYVFLFSLLANILYFFWLILDYDATFDLREWNLRFMTGYRFHFLIFHRRCQSCSGIGYFRHERDSNTRNWRYIRLWSSQSLGLSVKSQNQILGVSMSLFPLYWCSWSFRWYFTVSLV
jgi:hypothetical protein